MALTTTTLSTAIAVGDTKIKIASATGLSAGMYLLIDQEFLKVTQDYVSGTTFNVLRGRNGSVAAAHVVTSNVTFGVASDFSLNAAQTVTTYPLQRAVQIVSITATSTLALPVSGEDLRVILNGTSVITLTVPVPTKDMDGCRLTIVGNGAAAHVLTFTGGLSGAGSSYDVVTVNATAPVAFEAIACNGLWNAIVNVPLAGTVTNITATVG